MRLLVISHKACWSSDANFSGYYTDGGFPSQMAALSELFTQTSVAVPCSNAETFSELTPLRGQNLVIVPLSVPEGSGVRRKIGMLRWILRNTRTLWREMRKADAVHTPIPGDIGTIGMVLALIQRKPLFVRHCGNWFVQRTVAERMWKRGMEYFAGGRNVMLATGGDLEPPSKRNPSVKWIFSTSMGSLQISRNRSRQLPKDDRLRLVIACRQEERKGTDVVIASLRFLPNATLDVIGGGSLLKDLKAQAARLGVGDRVTFHGKVRQTAVLDVLDRSHIFCYPTSASEGFPKVVLEALAHGLPVITTNISVLPRLISEGCGMLLDEPTPNALAAAVSQISSSDTDYDRMSRKALETAQQYSLENWRDSIGRSLREAWEVDSLSTTLELSRNGGGRG